MGLVLVIYEEKEIDGGENVKVEKGGKNYQKRVFLGNEHKKIRPGAFISCPLGSPSRRPCVHWGKNSIDFRCDVNDRNA